MTKVIAVTGGIGSGKSVVCRVLRAMGHEVYDCDLRAKKLMDESISIRRDLIAAFGDAVIDNVRKIDRRYLSEIVFNDAQALRRLNEIVHEAVRQDLSAHINKACRDGLRLFFFETAILAEARLDAVTDRVWLVTCPAEKRVKRIMCRNNLTEAQARARIASQRPWPESQADVIINDDCRPMLPRILELIETV